MAKGEITEVKDSMSKITDLSKKVATHFCESEQSFKLEEFLSIMKTFCEKVQVCQKVIISLVCCKHYYLFIQEQHDM